MKTIEVKNWQFFLGDEKNAWQKDFIADNWENIQVPHDWSVHQHFTREASSGTGYLPGGIGWYRGTIDLAEITNEMTIRLVFEGVYKNAQVWVNGYHVGARPSGYATFSFDISEIIEYTLDNRLVIAVRVDHTDIADSRWYNGSGINRPVRLEYHKAVQIVESGTFFETKSIANGTANVELTHEVKNNSSQKQIVQILEELVSLTNGDVLFFEKTIILEKNETKKVVFQEQIKDPLLWSNHQPNLYSLKTHLNTEAYKSKYEEIVGIRTFEFTPDHGFSINGVNEKLKGVCLHEDAGSFGTAVPSIIWLRRLLKLKDMGANAIRMAHNPHSKSLYQLCDLLGFYVIDEAFDEWENPKNKWWQGHNVYPPKHEGYAEYFPNWHQSDLENMIDTNKNHASIIAWSIGNEIDYPNDPYANPKFSEMTGNNDASKPEAERIYNPNRPDTRRLSTIAKKLIDIAKSKDHTRPITLAAAFPELSSYMGLLDHLDLIGYNYKEHLYADDHLRFPNQPFIGSENGHTYEQWLAVADNDYIGGQFLWTGIDYLGEAHGWPIHGSGAGLLTLAGFEKINYYLRKSWWTDQPIVHLATRHKNQYDWQYYPFFRNWDYAEGTLIEVYCFSNCERVELTSGNQTWEMVYDTQYGYFKAEIEVTKDPLKAIGYTGNQQVEDILVSRSTGSEFRLKSWKAPDKLVELAEKATQMLDTTIYQVECELLDGLQNRASNDSVVHVEVENGELLGIENGNLADITSYSDNYRATYQGQLIVYIKGNSETVMTLHSEGVKTQTVKLSDI